MAFVRTKPFVVAEGREGKLYNVQGGRYYDYAFPYADLTAASGFAQSVEGGSLRAAVDAYIRGLRTRPPVVFGIGDSNFTGEGGGDGAGAVPKLNKSFGKGPIEQISTHTPTLAGLTLRNTSWFGEGNCNNNGVVVSAYNPRITLGTNWARTTGSTQGALFGSHMVGSAGSAGYFEYDFGSAITHVEIYMVVNATNSASVGIYTSDNVLVTTLNTNGASAAAVFTVTGRFTDGIIKVKNNGAANCYIAGMIAWNDGDRSIIMCRGSYSGATVASYSVTTNVWDGMGYYPLIQPDIAIVSVMINDIAAGTTRANYNTGLSYIADFVVRYGDLIISTGGNGTNAAWTNGTSVGIEAEAKIVAAKYGGSFVSLHKEWVSHAATTTAGQEYDGNHRKVAGYLDQARVYSGRLLAMLSK